MRCWTLACFKKITGTQPEISPSITIVSGWTAMVPRTPEKSGRYCKTSSRQEDENIWDVPYLVGTQERWKQAVIEE